MTRDEYLKHLRENNIFKEVLSQASNETERRAIKAYTEDFVLKFFNDVHEPLSKAVQNDPDIINKVYLELEKNLINSGSNDDT